MKTTPHIDMLTDGQSGAGGFFRVFDAQGGFEDVDTEAIDEALCETGDVEPLIELVTSVAQRCGITLVRDGGLQSMDDTDDGEPITLEKWASLARAQAC